MNSDCEKMKDQIADHITGILSEAQMQSLELHLNECTSCREYARALKEEDALLTELFAEIETDMASRQEQILRKVNQLCVSKQTESHSIRRIIMKNQITKYVALFVILICAGALATTVGIKVRKLYFMGKESDGTYIFQTKPETVNVGDGRTVTNIRTVGVRAEPNQMIDVEQKIKDLEEVGLLRQQDTSRELLSVVETEVNGKLQPRSLKFKYILSDEREIKIMEPDPDTQDRENSLTAAQDDEVISLLRADEYERLDDIREKEVRGCVFVFTRQKFVLSDGTEVIKSHGRPK
jgi:hypothetical protein